MVRPARWTAWLALGLLATAGCREPARFRFEGGRLHVETPRYAARFELGALTALTNRLTGEVYATAGTNLAARLPHLMHGLCTTAGLDDDGRRELQTLHQWCASYPYGSVWASIHHPTAESEVAFERLSAGRVRVTWKGLKAFKPDAVFPEETFTLDVEVLPESGELAIGVRASAAEPGVYGNGFLMANFAKTLRFVLPETNGHSFVPGDEPGAGATHWPQPWHAALVIGQGTRGSFGLWMADPAMRDRYLHKRNHADGYDVMFESVNHAPFEALTEAESRPIRINVYEGNWLRPARAFRDWWERAFEVRPLAEREPAWLRDVAFATYHYSLPPAEMVPRTLLWAPQHWKTGPEIGDTGLFPYDIENGPELKALASSLPRIKEQGGHVMVYLNINHMNEGHPWAPKYWDRRLIRPFGQRPEERDPKMQSPHSYLVHSAFKPWQDLVLWWAEESYRRFGIDGFYMDCAVGHPNGLFGPVDGKNDCQGEVELMTRMKAAIPGCWLGVEYVTEVTATAADTGFVGYDSWWPGSLEQREKTVHPILGFLFNRYVHLWYCSGSDPVFDEVMGRLPHTPVEDLGDDYVTDYCVAQDFAAFLARLRFRTRIQAVYPEDWEAGVRAYYADPEGRMYKVLADTPRESRMVRCAPDGREELLYWRIKDRRTAGLSPGTGIDGWLAYDGDTAAGLDPERPYLYTAGPRIRDWELVRLPEGAVIAVNRPYTNGLLVVELESAGGEEREGTVELRSACKLRLALNRRGVTPLEPLGEEDGRYRYRARAVVPGTLVFAAGEPLAPELPEEGDAVFRLWTLGTAHYAQWNHSGLRMPIAKARLPRAGADGVVILLPQWTFSAALDYLLNLPPVAEGQRLLLRTDTLIRIHAGNHAQFIVRVNGTPVLAEQVHGSADNTPAPQAADLTPFAGQTVLLSLQARDCYLFDWLRLIQPRVTVE